MARKRRRFTAEFKGRVALEALRERDSVQAIAAGHELHPNQVSAWKRQLLDAVPEVFAKGGRRKLAKEHDAKVHDLHAKIGELTVERDFLSARVEALSRAERVRGCHGRPAPDPAAHGSHGDGGYLPAAAHERGELGAPDLSLPATRPRDLPDGSCVVRGHHL